MGGIVTVIASLALQIVFTNFPSSIKITFKYRRNGTYANFVRRNGIRQNGIRRNGHKLSPSYWYAQRLTPYKWSSQKQRRRYLQTKCKVVNQMLQTSYMMLLLLWALPIFSHQRLSIMSYTTIFPSEYRDQFTWREDIISFKIGCTLGEVGPPSNRPLHPTPCQLAGNKLVHKRVGGVVKPLQGGGAWAYSPSEPPLHFSGVVIFKLKQSTATIVPTESNIFHN